MNEYKKLNALKARAQSGIREYYAGVCGKYFGMGIEVAAAWNGMRKREPIKN